jgi:uncharacterized membrane protein YeiH
MAFAATGAFKAIDHKSDIVGVIILSTITGVAGGVIRDIIFGIVPPTAVINPLYSYVTVSTGIAIFLLYPKMKSHQNLFLKFDAVGLGVFTIIGSNVAYNIFGLNFLAMILGGILTALGGGILRDVFVNEVPLVFIKELYASPSFAGAVIFFVMIYLNIPISISTVSSILIITCIRLLAMKYNWNLPRIKEDNNKI